MNKDVPWEKCPLFPPERPFFISSRELIPAHKGGIHAMKYSPEEVIQFVQEEDVKFIRLAFCDVYGKQKNITIMPSQLQRAFTYGVAFDASAIAGFGGEVRSDLFLHPDPATLISLDVYKRQPWYVPN